MWENVLGVKLVDNLLGHDVHCSAIENSWEASSIHWKILNQAHRVLKTGLETLPTPPWRCACGNSREEYGDPTQSGLWLVLYRLGGRGTD